MEPLNKKSPKKWKKSITRLKSEVLSLEKLWILVQDWVQVILEIFYPLGDRVKGGFPNFLDHIIFVIKPYIPNFIPLGPFLHVKKFVMGVCVCVL